MTQAGVAAAIMAAQVAARQQREEEAMAQYSEDDLTGGWEFKFLRSARGEFKRPEKLREYLDEEARAGWTLLEKFDNARLRLKRPVRARSKDGSLGFDAYRTSVGTSEGKFVLLLMGGIFLTIGVIVGIVVLVKGP